MYDPEAEHFFKAIEIAVSVQQLVFTLQTKSSDQTVDGFPNRMTIGAKEAIVLC